MDRLTPARRSEVMSRVRAKDTGPEMVVRRHLHKHGLRYVLHDKRLPGKPDLVFPSRRTVVFVHGCFWHAHAGCKRATLPSTRTEFWAEKIGGNAARDQRVEASLLSLGWRVITIWQCEINPERLDKLAVEIRQQNAR